MKKRFLGTLAMATLMVGCIPLNKFDEANQRAHRLEEEAAILRSENEALKISTTEASSALARYKEQVGNLLKDTTDLGKRFQRLQYKYADLNKNYSDALARMQSAGHGDADNRELLAFLQKLQEELQSREDALQQAENDLAQRERELYESQQRRAAQDEHLTELEQALRQKDQALLALRKSISDALTGFSSDELKVHMKDGKVYVSLEEKLLFQSGSYQVNTQGTDALIKIARVLEENGNIEIIVEGHTDKIPYKGSVLVDNWDLSVKRATSVVRIMTSNSNIQPSRITAAGRSAYLPVQSGSDAAALQANRRTEIILSPKIDQILNLLENN